MYPTPRAITSNVLSLCRELVPDPKPVFIPVTPEPNAKSLDCFPVVTCHAEEHGGSVCYGWQIWETPGFMIEAEFHAIWRDPRGGLHDITPKRLPVTEILFLPDPVKKYDGRQVNNVRRPLSDDPRIKPFFDLCDKEFELLDRGQRDYEHGAIRLVGDEAAALQNIQRRKDELEMELAELWTKRKC